MRHKPEIEEVTIVVIGSFSPGIMNQHWLAYHDIISKEEADEARVTLTHPQVSQIDLGWGKFFANENRVQIATTQSPWIRAGDFIVKLLSEAAPGQPVTALGINVSTHYSLGFIEREDIGQRLAPREFWGEWGTKLKNPDPTNPKNGLTTITMRQGSDLPNKFNKYVDVRISASDEIKPSGIEIYINDHYTFQDDPDSSLSSQVAWKELTDQFEASLNRSHSIIDGIITRIKP